MQGFFITGTDTGVGKTAVTAGLAANLKRLGLNVGVMKPLQTGSEESAQGRVSGDGLFAMQVAGITDPINIVSPYRLEPPLAPRIAAEITGVTIEIDTISRASAAALANLELFDKDNLIAVLQEKVSLFTNGLKRFKKLQHVGNVRHKGLMAGIEIVENKATKEPFSVKYNIPHRIVLEARKNGLIIRPLDNVMVLMPILSMSFAELQQVLDITYAAIRLVTEEEVLC